MAVAPLTPNEQAELNRLLEENAEIKERIRIINEKIALATGSERDDLEAMAQTEKIRLRLQTDSVKEFKKRQKFLDEEKSITAQIVNLSHGANKVLNRHNTQYSSIASISAEIIKRKEEELSLDGDALKQSQEGTAVLESITAEVVRKAEELAALKGQ
jgi:hypothetical protein